MTTSDDIAKKPAGRSLLGGLFKLLIILSVGGLGGGGFYLWQQQKMIVSETTQKLKHVENQSSALQNRLAGLNDKIGGVSKATAALKQQSDSAIDLMKKSVKSQNAIIKTLSTTDRQDWLLAEAQYLLSLANQRVVIEREASTAIALLKTADQILQGLDDINLAAVRQKIQTELINLQLADALDREGMYLSLVVLTEKIDSLPINQQGTESIKLMDIPEIDQTLNFFEKFKASVVSTFSVFSDHIKYVDLSVQPLLPPDQYFYVRQNIRFMLEQAQLALLREQQDLFETSLMKSKGWLENYFAMTDQERLVILGELDKMMRKNIVLEMPDISGSSEILEKYINRLHKVKAVTVNSMPIVSDDIDGEG